nr:putative nuclease HARBI1 [Dermacentor andersoni]
MCRKGYYALNTMFICDAGMRILAVDPLRPGSDHDAHVWTTTWLRRQFLEGHIAKAGEHLLGDSGYHLEPWLLSPVTGHPPLHTAEGRYNTAHAAMRSVVERCIGLLKSRFRCLQRYRALHYEPERVANIVAACAVLHNLCLDEGDVLLDDVSDDSSNSSSDDESGNPSPQRLPRPPHSFFLQLKPGARGSVKPARRVAVALQERVQQELDKMERDLVIAKSPIGNCRESVKIYWKLQQ